MKKWSLWLFVAIITFALTPKDVDAFSGLYSYDINKVDIEGSNLVITGWAAINKEDGQEMHNINPTYKLDLIGKTNEGVDTISKKGYVDVSAASRPAYSSGTSTPRDYTKAYFMNYSGRIYPSGAVPERGTYVKESGGTNYFYINIDFKFEIPISDFKEILAESDRVYLNLTVSNSAGTHTVFGATGITTSNKTVPIPIGIQNDRVKDITKEAFKGLEFNGTINELTVIVTYGYVQGSSTGFLKNNYRLVLQDGKIVKKPPGSTGFTNLYYYGERHFPGNESSYTIIAHNQLYDLSGNNSYYYYTINVSPGGSCYSGRCAGNGGSTIAYVPAFWAKPITGGLTYITGQDDVCQTLPACKGLTKDCPDVCCDELCTDPANEGSAFCRQVCYTPPPVVDLCKDISDAEKQYCCYNPQDKELCEKEFPKKDTGPQNKSGTCSSSGDTEITFKYPKLGWGHTLLNNQACNVSCQEEMKLTFEPRQYVRAGMGWDYPVTENGTRICAAAYKNDSWTTKMNNAVTAAKKAYDNMVSWLKTANDRATSCGSKVNNPTSVSQNKSCGPTCGGCSVSCPCNCPSDNDYSSSNYWTFAYLYSNPPKEKNNTIPNENFERGYLGYNPNLPVFAEEGGGEKEDPCPEGYGSDSCSCGPVSCDRYYCSGSGSRWNSGQSSVKQALDQARSYKNQYETQKGIIDGLNRDRSTCDNWIASNPYLNSSQTTITVGAPNQSSYTKTYDRYIPTNSIFANKRLKKDSYNVQYCNYGSHNVSKSSYNNFSTGSFDRGTYCTGTYYNPTTFIDFWVEKSVRDLEYEFSTRYYVQRYTGELRSSSSPGYDYHGRYSYTDFYTMSGSRGFALNMRNVGPNLGTVSKTWSVNPFSCQYYVDNMIFPQKGDPNNSLYGNVAFMYRQVSLENPFPSRSPGENWGGRVSLITSNGYKVYAAQPKYTINLNPTILQNIRSYGTNYGSFYINDPYRSLLVESYVNSGVIVKGK